VTVHIPRWALLTVGAIAITAIAFFFGRGCSDDSRTGQPAGPASTASTQGGSDSASSDSALPCDKPAAQAAIDQAIREHGDPEGTIRDTSTGGIGNWVGFRIISCEDLTGDGVREMVAEADGVQAGGAIHPVNWFIFTPDGDSWSQALRREQPLPEVEVANGIATEATGVFRPSDPLCCPSAERTGEVRYVDGRFQYFPSRELPKRLGITVASSTNTIQSIGPFDAYSANGTDFRQVLGEPNFTVTTGSSDETCLNVWNDIGLSVNYVDLGGGDSCAGLVGSFSLRGDATQHAGWEGPDGLKVGASMSKLRGQFPGMERSGYPDPNAPDDSTAWTLISRPSPYAEGGTTATVTAYVSGGQAFRIDYSVGAGGE